MIAATLHGPNYGAPNHEEHSIEVFNHLGEVVDALFERMNSNGQYPCTVRTLDGKSDAVLFPVFGEDVSFTCFKVAVVPNTSDAIDFPQFHEAVMLDVLSAVHGGHWDYEAVLVRTDEDLITVNVEKAGMS